jgi:hypothetical protein
LGIQRRKSRELNVNAVDTEAANFWKRHGIIPSKDDPLILFRSLADIAASITSPSGSSSQNSS